MLIERVVALVTRGLERGEDSMTLPAGKGARRTPPRVDLKKGHGPGGHRVAPTPESTGVSVTLRVNAEIDLPEIPVSDSAGHFA
jgi:hypothetical protein